MQKHMKPNALGSKQISLEDGTNMRCIQTRLRSAVKSVMKLNRLTSGLSDLDDAAMAVKGKKKMELQSAGRMQSVAVVEKEAGDIDDIDGEPALVKTRSRRRLGSSRTKRNTPTGDDEGSRNALQRRRERRNRRLGLKSGKATNANNANDEANGSIIDSTNANYEPKVDRADAVQAAKAGNNIRVKKRRTIVRKKSQKGNTNAAE